jgi:radical SAM protein with 4Fe4S-binding SPASM domain
MKAVDLTGQAPTKRQKLQELLPLETPLVFSVFPVYLCNFKCNYCVMSLPVDKRHFISNEVYLDFSLYVKAINSLTLFNNRLKTLRFVGIGEPLIHNDIVKMIAYAKEIDIAEKVEIITNGYFLNNTLIQKLITSKLDRLVISIQGVDAESYKDITGVNIDFDKFVKQIEYFYNIKKDTHVYIKIADTALKNESDKEKFFNIFGNICDTIAIETIVPIQEGIELEQKNKTQFGEDLIDFDVCPMSFYYLQLNPDGNIVPCYSFNYPKVLGNIKDIGIYDYWNSEELKQFRLEHINGTNNKICSSCEICRYRMHKEDLLNREVLENVFKKNL